MYNFQGIQNLSCTVCKFFVVMYLVVLIMSVKFAHAICLTSSDFVQNLVLRFTENLYFDCNGFLLLNISSTLYHRPVIHRTEKKLTRYRGR